MELIEAWLKSIGNYTLSRLLPALLLLFIGMLAIRGILRLVQGAIQKTRLEQAAHTLIRSVLRIALYLLLGLILASWLGIDVTSVVALASVLTLALSLSIQNALSNIIGGFTLLCTKPFVTGDFVEIAGQSGTVREIGLTYTKMATPDNKLISVPNSSVTAAQIVNYTTTGTRRVEILVHAAYTAPVAQVLAALKKAAQLPMNLTDPAPEASVHSYGDSAIVYRLFIWCRTQDYWTCQTESTRNIKAVFDAEGIEMTYPHMHVHIEK